MGSGLRQPLPWETDQTPRRVDHVLVPRESTPPVEVLQAARLAGYVDPDPDPHRARRGARGAANQHYQYLVRHGLAHRTTPDAMRARADSARSRAIARERDQ